jgi:hypothetical protein
MTALTARTHFSRGIGLAALLTLMAACASSSAPNTGSSTPSAIAVGASGGSQRGVGLEVTARVDGQQVSVAADPAAVFTALEGAYEALQISLSRRDPEKRILGNDGLKMRRELGKIQLRRAFECGGTAGMPNSETYTITAGITSAVAADGTSGSTVTTVVDASAENPSFPGSGVRCSSNGTIEAAIEREMKARLNSR